MSKSVAVEKALTRFHEQARLRAAYRHATMILQYDADTTMPVAGASILGDTMGVLAEKTYEALVNDDTRETLAVLLAAKDEVPRHIYSEAEELQRKINKISVVPAKEYGDYERAVTHATHVWRQAKLAADFNMFAPYLQAVVDYAARFAKYYDSSRPVYDVLLEDYEQGMTMAKLDDFFGVVRQELTPLIARIAKAPQPDTAFLNCSYPLPQQEQLAHYLMNILCLPRDRCAIGTTEHPFTAGANNHDVRITTHYYEQDMLSGMFTVIHEGGHALYMLHMADELNGTLLAKGASSGIHESQSRFFENFIGRSEPFLRFILPKLQELFPAQLKGVTAEQFYHAANRSQPSLIRIHADELTYPLHILIRYELEKQLFAGEIAVADLPQKWNELYQTYLGITPPDDGQGVLQDVHWSNSYFGYFPTYALGSAYAAQFLAAMEHDIDVSGTVAVGDLHPVIDWLKDRLFCFGGVKLPEELLIDITGKPFAPHCYTDYLKHKYSALYGLD